jgi:hypothetical protein
MYSLFKPSMTEVTAVRGICDENTINKVRMYGTCALEEITII